jgi:GATA-binding protein
MSGATRQYEERGGILRSVYAPFDTMVNRGGEASQNLTASTSSSITEHDYRFPRRPEQQHDDVPNANSTFLRPDSSSTSSTAASALDNLDFTSTSSARKDLLRESFFPSWKDDAAGDEMDSPDEMQRKDPLATQIWKLYSKTKKQLPNQERMENLTWRMMAMSLRKRKQQEEAARYAWNDSPSRDTLLTLHHRLAKQNPTSTPSGIAQLRKSSDQRIGQSAETSEAMNLDDYIFSDNVSTPLGFGASSSPELNKKDADRTNHAVASAIPIKMRKESAQFAVPQSVPVPHHNPRHNEEFNYVQRHVRKTSIDERRVSIAPFVACVIL